MTGTKAGGLKAAKTNKELHGDDFYRNIGRKGGQNGHTGGFASNPELARIAGAVGGHKSRRPKMDRDAEGNAIKKNGERIVYIRRVQHNTECQKAEEPKEDKKGFFSKIFGGK